MHKIMIALGICMALTASAETLKFGCAARTYDCTPTSNGTLKCSWGSDMGNLSDIEIQKTGSGPSYEIWEGTYSGMVHGKYPYTLLISQRRESNQSFNYLRAQIKVDGVTVISNGQNIVEARYLRESDNFGIGIHCSTDLVSDSRHP